MHSIALSGGTRCSSHLRTPRKTGGCAKPCSPSASPHSGMSCCWSPDSCETKWNILQPIALFLTRIATCFTNDIADDGRTAPDRKSRLLIGFSFKYNHLYNKPVTGRVGTSVGVL